MKFSTRLGVMSSRKLPRALCAQCGTALAKRGMEANRAKARKRRVVEAVLDEE